MREAALVTGGAGFIGSQLVRDLVAADSRVLVLDNFSFGRASNLDGVTDVEVLNQDLRTVDSAKLAGILKRFGVRRVFHLAALHFIPYCESNPDETLLVNVTGTRRLLGALDGGTVRRFVFASTGDVYGFSRRRMSESFHTQPFNIYGYSKLCGEGLLQMSSRRLPRIGFAVARLFNTFGPRETNPHVIPQIIEQVRRAPVLQLGNLTPRRDYVYVEDVSRALFALSSVRPRWVTCNVCCGQGRSVRDVVSALSAVLRCRLRVRVDPARVRKVERPCLIGDNRALRSLTGWRPQETLLSGLGKLACREGLVRDPRQLRNLR